MTSSSANKGAPPHQTMTTTDAGAPSPQTPQAPSDPLHTAAIVATPLALVALFLPPRRLDLRMVTLGGISIWGVNQLKYDYTGTSFLTRVNSQLQGVRDGLPEEARQMQARIRQDKEARRRTRGQELEKPGKSGDTEQGGGGNKEMSALGRLWKGEDREAWLVERQKKEEEAMKEGGGGIWGLIVDQIAEVCTWKTKEERERAENDRDSRRADEDGDKNNR